MKYYRKVIEDLVAKARDEADKWSERDGDRASDRSDALEAFADAIEDALEELSVEWEG